MQVGGTNRRAFIAGIGGAVAWPMLARAQQPERMLRIGLMTRAADDPAGQAQLAAFRSGAGT
jgi:putative ABC transport system substrate-binding protein